MSLADGFQTFTVVVNIGVPALRITLGWWLHHRIAWEVAEWLLQEALNAADAQQLAVCDEFVASLHRLQDTFPDYDLWKHLKGKNAGCCEAATGKVQQPQSHRGLRLFVLLQQVVAEEESTAERWEKVMELLKKCTTEQIQAAKGSIRKAALHLEPSELVLESRHFEWVAATTILEAIPKPEKVTTLHLHVGYNNLGPGGARVVGEAVAKFQQITNLVLVLSDNNIGAEGAKAVGGSLAKLEQITNLVLVLSDNNIGAEGAKAVGDSLTKLEQITNLQLLLGGNNIGAEGAKAVGDSLAKLEQITNLKLVGIPDEVVDEIRHQLKKPGRTVVLR